MEGWGPARPPFMVRKPLKNPGSPWFLNTCWAAVRGLMWLPGLSIDWVYRGQGPRKRGWAA